jgi:hypothetical protein
VLIKTGRKVIKKTTMLSTPLEKKDRKPVEATIYMLSDIFLVLSSHKSGKMKVDLNLHYKFMRVADVDYGGGDGGMLVKFMLCLFSFIFCKFKRACVFFIYLFHVFCFDDNAFVFSHDRFQVPILF